MMGLDTFASRSPDDIELTEEDLQAFHEANIELCGGIFSSGGVIIEVEVDSSNGQSKIFIVGLPDAAIQESREKVQSAIKNSGFTFPDGRATRFWKNSDG